MSQKNNKFIGVFDSGFGGLDILRGIVRQLPNYNYIYLGDTARTPYGSRSKEIIYEFTKQALDFLFKNDCQLVILACNTASSDALKKIQQEYLSKYYPNRRVLGVLIPAAEEAVQRTRNKKVGVIGTEQTVSSGAFRRELTKIEPTIRVFQKTCSLLVPFVEAGLQNSKALDLVLKDYLNPLTRKGIDTLILGCTHYGILENKIRKIIGSDIRIVSEAKIVPGKLKDYLLRHKDIEGKISRNKIVRFYSTDLTNKFKILGSKFFGQNIHVQRAILKSSNL